METGSSSLAFPDRQSWGSLHIEAAGTSFGSPSATLLILTLPQVQGAEEAHKERQRQKELESNYRRVWGSRDGEGTGDLDEFDF